ncbi:MarR family transcriptional regulator [Candidatus Methylobacter favarea]|uniref:MarR family transcriptional regulator n=1 Tax=Candidatus Methylobacter favarea TaxID=2707345 RepID=A0A8S0YA78_9GAMM|nr:MarR family winged helix-turn-helix transcriptional regulator [Candidatus Methylobacter favarea]CAA9891251.1 MarR family transcriptional regulator [Candidatus Methylobacter favarea]
MEKVDVFDLIERMTALMRAEERRKCTELGLQPVHLQILDYLSRCNRYSDTPAALANFLGMTRGTVSQTLLLLVKKGFIKKSSDAIDRRIVHLALLQAGEAILKNARSSELFNQASLILRENNFLNQEEVFVKALLALQKANKSQSFGLCKTCRYFTRSSEGLMCGLTHEPLSQSDSEKICQEHSVA